MHDSQIELVKRGNKTLVIPEGTPESQLGILINKFTGGVEIENLPGAIREVLQKSNPRLHGFHDHRMTLNYSNVKIFLAKSLLFK